MTLLLDFVIASTSGTQVPVVDPATPAESQGSLGKKSPSSQGRGTSSDDPHGSAQSRGKRGKTGVSKAVGIFAAISHPSNKLGGETEVSGGRL